LSFVGRTALVTDFAFDVEMLEFGADAGEVAGVAFAGGQTFKDDGLLFEY
jgi:hypothetical protein